VVQDSFVEGGEHVEFSGGKQVDEVNVLDGFDVIGHPSSYFLWLPLPEEARTDQVAAALMRETSAVSTAEAFATSRNPPHAIRLALGSVSLDVLTASLDTVKRVIDAYRY
jgi:DNA-binding transcriptional MocR family regulator